ncbi:NAD(P)-dependent oxidoreductase [Heyndrickxia acidicola]|uniref:NAD(P)H-binding protein n=1 Tax=Heyndrickxia acidicola TaxID=209389 RepID=A0ABU6MN33_9BACI|nr:NAD(P)H-binding protein [Heyndrickxia acidicola]MED1205807.1 NAD(P)H-binding protein [Heyndrickxia acidicola]
MNISLFGANGAIGQLVLKHALQNDDFVTSFVRRENSISITHEKLKVAIGNLTNEAKVEEAIRDADVIISTLGPALDTSRKVKSLPIADGHKIILTMMEKLGKKRFITLVTPTVKAKEDKNQFATVVPGAMAKWLFPTGYQEMKTIEQLVTHSNLEWTLVRIINPNVKHVGQEYSISLGDTKAKMGVSRENVAQFIYDIVKNNKYIKQMPIVFNK